MVPCAQLACVLVLLTEGAGMTEQQLDMVRAALPQVDDVGVRSGLCLHGWCRMCPLLVCMLLGAGAKAMRGKGPSAACVGVEVT